MQRRKLGNSNPSADAKRTLSVPEQSSGAEGLRTSLEVNVELTPDDWRAIENASGQIVIKGARLPEAALKLTGR